MHLDSTVMCTTCLLCGLHDSILAMLADWVLSMRGLVCFWLDCSYSAAALVLALVLDPVRHARVLHRKHSLTYSTIQHAMSLHRIAVIGCLCLLTLKSQLVLVLQLQFMLVVCKSHTAVLQEEF